MNDVTHPVTQRRSAGEAPGYLGDPRIGDNQMVEVPGRECRVGIAEDKENPERTVRVETFRIDQYPVTNAQFKKFVDSGGYDRLEYWSPGGWT